MKLYATITSDKGTQKGTGGNEYLDIDIKVGNDFLARLTVREDANGAFKLYDEDDTEIRCRAPQENRCAWCNESMYVQIKGHSHTENGEDVTKSANATGK